MRHSFGPYSKASKGKGHPLMFSFKECEMYDDFPEGGGYPKRFIPLALETLGCDDPNQVLHLCSGSVYFGFRVDIRKEKNPDLVADCRDTGLPSESRRWIMADPPYSEEYARNLYGTESVYPKPSQILKEACRILEPGGRVGLLHFQVPMFRKPLKLVGVWGVTTGLGFAIRAWSVFEKADK